MTKAVYADTPAPNSHEILVNSLSNDAERYHGRVSSYDIRLSGTGYFVATQDTVVSSISERMLESLAHAASRTYCCTSEMLDDLGSGKLVLAYNLRSSYGPDAGTGEDEKSNFYHQYSISRTRTAGHNVSPWETASPTILPVFTTNRGERACKGQHHNENKR